MQSDGLLSIYIHIPFCRTRCGYCDFNTYAGYDHLIDEYINAVIKEICNFSKKIDNRFSVHTIYFGGGTPNLLSSYQLEKIIKAIKEKINIAKKIEISTEANPSCLPLEYLISLREIGINRLSLGMQSASAEDLKVLGRRHTYKDVETSVKNAEKAGFSNISLDLIFGIPLQTLMSFENTLKVASDLSPNHLSLYALSVEDSTPLAFQISNKVLPEPDDDLAADMYLLAMEFLEKHEFGQYEISNWAKDDESRCLHNLQYWRNLDYIGFGAGAHSHIGRERWENFPAIADYIDSVSKSIQSPEHINQSGINKVFLSEKDDMSETMMMGMRLTDEGVNEERFFERFKVNLDEIYSKEISKLIERKLIEWIVTNEGRRLRMTRKGRLLGNQVFLEFIRD